MVPRDFFVDLGVTHIPTDFYPCALKWAPGLQFRGPCLAIWPRPLAKPLKYVNLCQTSQACEVWCILSKIYRSYKGFVVPGTWSKWWPRHAHTVTPIRKILITFHVTGLKSVHTSFHDIPIKFVGGVCLSALHVRFGHFLSPGGGDMSMAEFQHMNGFRAGL